MGSMDVSEVKQLVGEGVAAGSGRRPPLSTQVFLMKPRVSFPHSPLSVVNRGKEDMVK